MTKNDQIYLVDLKKNEKAIITGFTPEKCINEEFATNLRDRLMEMGFEIDREIEVLHKGLIGGDPIAVRIGHMTIAIRKTEAAAITVATSRIVETGASSQND